MASHFWNNGWLYNQRLSSARDVLFRTTFAPRNITGAGPVAFNAYYFGPASTGSISGNATIGTAVSGNLGSSGTRVTAGHLWNNSWLMNYRLGSCPDGLLRQTYLLANTSEAGAGVFNAYYFGQLSGAIAGAASISFAASGTLQAAGTLAGAATLTFSEAGALKGAGALAGAASIAFALSGTAVGSGTLLGAAALQFAASGNLLGIAPAVGSATIAFSEAGELLGAGALTGAANFDCALNGTLVASGALSGASAVAFVAVGDISGAVIGSGASTLPGATTAGSGTFVPPVTGSGASTLPGVTTSGTGHAIAGGEIIPLDAPIAVVLLLPSPIEWQVGIFAPISAVLTFSSPVEFLIELDAPISNPTLVTTA